MRNFHRTVALLTLGAFVGTGLYMHFGHDHLQQTPGEIKAFQRSRRINLLMIGITILALSAYIQPHPSLGWLQYFASLIFGCSAAAITVAFFCEVYQPNLRSSLSSIVIQSLPVGIAIHLYAGWKSSPACD